MSELTLSEAIKHCLEVAEQKEHDSITTTGDHELDIAMKEGCIQCAADHRQLAAWLTELKQWRRVYGICPSYEMCIPECREGYDAQIAEYKRLLKAAVDDIYKARQGCNCNICDMPPEPTERCQYENGEDCQFKWRYADEALKLIGDEPNGV